MSGQSSQWEFGELFNERAESRKVYTVSKLNRLAKSLLEGQLGNVWVEGEQWVGREFPHMEFAVSLVIIFFFL